MIKNKCSTVSHEGEKAELNVKSILIIFFDFKGIFTKDSFWKAKQ
jgi:hypothetical protein